MIPITVSILGWIFVIFVVLVIVDKIMRLTNKGAIPCLAQIKLALVKFLGW